MRNAILGKIREYSMHTQQTNKTIAHAMIFIETKKKQPKQNKPKPRERDTRCRYEQVHAKMREMYVYIQCLYM